jgi:hypothetical protein
MLAYSKDSVGPYITEHYNGYVEASMQGCCKGSLVPSVTGHYNV